MSIASTIERFPHLDFRTSLCTGEHVLVVLRRVTEEEELPIVENEYSLNNREVPPCGT